MNKVEKIETSKKNTKRRIFWLDVLRIISILAVVTIHVSTQNLGMVAAGSAENIVLSGFDGLARFAVPVFVMISGALMLGRDVGIKKCLKKIGRLFIVWVFWCVFYAGMTLLMGKGKEAALRELAFGHFHMWFLPMIAVLYLITPILRLIFKNQRWCVVLIVVLLVVSVGLRFRWSAYPMFYLMGHMLGNGNIEVGRRKKAQILVFLGLFLASVVAISALNVRASVNAGAVIHPEDADWSILTAVQSVALFMGIKIFAKGRPEKGVEQKICSHLASDVLGVYLVHIAILGLLNRVGVSNVMFQGGAGVFAGTFITIMLTTALSVGAIEIMRKIPLLKKVV